MDSPQHTLSIDAWKDSLPVLSLRCHHAPGEHGWHLLDDGDGFPTRVDCFFASWWRAIGWELLDFRKPLDQVPVPVRPSDNWTWDDGMIVVDDYPYSDGL